MQIKGIKQRKKGEMCTLRMPKIGQHTYIEKKKG